MAVDFEVMLASDIGSFTRDPLRFVLYAFPWGQGELADFDGPDDWQRHILGIIGEKLKSGASQGMASANRRWWRGSSCGL